MGGNYEKGIYNQLMEVMERLETVENKLKNEVTKLNEKISSLENIIDEKNSK